MRFVQRVLFAKSFMALIFAGLVCAYMVCGELAGLILRTPFAASMPFIFIIEGLLVSFFASGVFLMSFSGSNVQKFGLVLRTVSAGGVLMVVVWASALLFVPFHTPWAKLWVGVEAVVLACILALFVLVELRVKPDALQG